MTKDEFEDGKGDMLIDEPGQAIALPNGFNANYLRKWDKTSLGESIAFFRSSFLQPRLKSCKEEIDSYYNAKLQQSRNTPSW